MTLMFYEKSPTLCRTQTFLLSIDSIAHNISAIGHPRSRDSTPQEKGLLFPGYGLIFNKKLGPRCLLLQLAYSLPFPTCLSHPMKCSPSLLNSPSNAPLPFWGFNNKSNKKYQNPISLSQHIRVQFPVVSHIKKNIDGPNNLPLLQHTGLTIHIFSINMGLKNSLFYNPPLHQ